VARLGWFVQRTLAVLKREGIAGTLQRLVKHARIAIGMPSRESLEYRRRKEEADRAYDEAMGVDTGGTQYLSGLTIVSPNAALGVSHIATGPEHFHRAMALLDIDPAGCAFVDLGSGKGRCLMMAADYPFTSITGIEFAEEMHAVCLANLEKFGDPRITPQLGDAEQFEYPPTDLVVYMNNPFDRSLVERIAGRIVASMQEHPRTVRLVYVNPSAPDMFAAEPWYHIASAEGAEVFGLRSAGAK
jgi:predicted RNA methylase